MVMNAIILITKMRTNNMLLKYNKKVLWLTIFSRVILLLMFQFLAYLVLSNKSDGFSQSITYWTFYVTFTNIVLLYLMIKYSDQNGYRGIFKFDMKHTVSFLKWLPLLFLSAMGPNLLLSFVIYRDIEIGAKLLLFDQGLLITIFNLSLFPIIQGLTEIPFYFLVLKPILKNHTNKPIFYLGIPIIMLSLQHIVMPLYFDLSYVLYRGFMFLGFSLFIGIMLDRNPGFMPYFIIIHIMMNLSFMMMQFV